jgi:dihydroorotate dehydrogenase
MTDRELLELAAKAAGMQASESDGVIYAGFGSREWNPLTNDHISYLNKGRKRTFTLEKDTGVINVLKTNIFKLANLDVELAKRITRNTAAA